MFGKLLGFLAFAVLVGSGATAQPADFRAKAEAVLEAAYPADGPGAAVVVMRGGQIVYASGRGMADVEGRRRITPDTVFRLGSITKQFTAAVILQLVHERRISLDDPLSRFFPDYPQPGARATVRQLLNHTSGIQSYTGIPGFMAGDAAAQARTTDEMIAIFRDQPSPTQPGVAWSYNNSGYLLLGAIIEKVTGKPWYQAVQERITRPLGLTSITYGVTGETVPAMAHGYTGGDNGSQQPARRIHMSIPHGAGALIGTVGDLAKWAQALHHGRVVDPALYQAMTTPTAMPDGSTQPYGFGLSTSDLRGRPAVGHSGGIFGFSTDSIYIPSDDLFVAVFANSDDPVTSPGTVMRRIAAIAVGDPFPEFTQVPIDVASLEGSFGVYRIGEGPDTRRFFTRDGKLYTQREGAGELEVFHAGNGRFFYPQSFTWFEIVRPADGAAIMEMHQDGATEAQQAFWVSVNPPQAPAVAVDAAVLRSYVGSYATPGPVVTIAQREDGRLTVQLTGQPALPLRAVSQTEFVVDGVEARIVFHPENGQVGRLVIHQGGNQTEARRTGS